MFDNSAGYQTAWTLPAALLHLSHQSHFLDKDTSYAACAALAALFQHVPVVKQGHTPLDGSALPSSSLISMMLEGESGLLVQAQRKERYVSC
jgi:hypothetical protein